MMNAWIAGTRRLLTLTREISRGYVAKIGVTIGPYPDVECSVNLASETRLRGRIATGQTASFFPRRSVTERRPAIRLSHQPLGGHVRKFHLWLMVAALVTLAS